MKYTLCCRTCFVELRIESVQRDGIAYHWICPSCEEVCAIYLDRDRPSITPDQLALEIGTFAPYDSL